MCVSVFAVYFFVLCIVKFIIYNVDFSLFQCCVCSHSIEIPKFKFSCWIVNVILTVEGANEILFYYSKCVLSIFVCVLV